MQFSASPYIKPWSIHIPSALCASFAAEASVSKRGIGGGTSLSPGNRGCILQQALCCMLLPTFLTIFHLSRRSLVVRIRTSDAIYMILLAPARLLSHHRTSKCVVVIVLSEPARVDEYRAVDKHATGDRHIACAGLDDVRVLEDDGEAEAGCLGLATDRMALVKPRRDDRWRC